MRKLMALAALALLAGAACGDDGGEADGDGTEDSEAAADADGATEDTEPNTVPACDAVDPEVVADLFAGDDATAEPQGNSCTYAVSNGLVDAVALVDPEPSSETWLSYKTMMEQGEAELVDVEGVGDEAYTFTPVPREPQLVVRIGLQMFRAGYQGDESPEAMEAMEGFAREVVDYLANLEDPPGGAEG